MHQDRVILSEAALVELAWWEAALETARDYAVPLASRFTFPTATQHGVLTHYGDASREFDEVTRLAAESSGFGAWTIIENDFVFIEGRWTHDECAHYSINVLELHTEGMGATTFVKYAKQRGVEVSHVLTFIDNTCAEFVAERGRTHSEGINQLNQRRHSVLLAEGISQMTERVASIFNDVADLLSRGDIKEALRHPREAGLKVIRLKVDADVRQLDGVEPTWA